MQKSSPFRIYFAPLQESTDHIYRSAHAKYFGGVTKYFAPYILRQNDGTVKASHLRDIKPDNNQEYTLIPQILAGNSTDFVFLAALLQEYGYEEINWNLGCPYPMVTNKGLGSGLLPFPDRIRKILEESLPKIQSRLSVKMRLGLNTAEEIFSVIDLLNDFPLAEVILHPRIARQLYKGTPDEGLYAEVNSRIKHPLVYNGDIETTEDFHRLNERFTETGRWMIGRGILKNPSLPRYLNEGILPEPEKRVLVLRSFHEEILLGYSRILNGNSHLMMKMEKFWSYFCFSFPDPHKTFKRIRKAANMVKYEMAVNENFQILRSSRE
jgi:tRNA-dihydrouridine synthase